MLAGNGTVPRGIRRNCSENWQTEDMGVESLFIGSRHITKKRISMLTKQNTGQIFQNLAKLRGFLQRGLHHHRPMNNKLTMNKTMGKHIVNHISWPNGADRAQESIQRRVSCYEKVRNHVRLNLMTKYTTILADFPVKPYVDLLVKIVSLFRSGKASDRRCRQSGMTRTSSKLLISMSASASMEAA